MTCCAGYEFTSGGDTTFEVDSSRIKYGSGALREAGSDARDFGMKRVGLVTDSGILQRPFFATVLESLRAAGCDVEIFAHARVEPTDRSFADAIAFANDGRFDGFVSVGGGSAIDTAKAANLYSCYPADFDAYVNAPIGRGEPVPGPLRPHIACPTTSGTGSEVTGIAIFDYLAHHAKTGIASKRLRPTLGIIDPDVTASLPATVVACSGFDVLSHALESYTALPYTQQVVSEALRLYPPGWLLSRRTLDADVLVLGCTHYPLIKPLLRRVTPEHVAIVDSAESTAQEVARRLECWTTGKTEPPLASATRAGSVPHLRFFATDSAEKFRAMGTRFLGLSVEDVLHVDLKE